MEKSSKKRSYIEWLSAEEMHEATVNWMSELKFIKDEQLFLNDLVKSHTLELVDSEVFDKSKKIIDALLHSEKEAVELMKLVQSHENLLEIMVNDVDELWMEKAYRETHWELLSEMERYTTEYRRLKKKLFKLVSKVIKKGQQKRLLN